MKLVSIIILPITVMDYCTTKPHYNSSCAGLGTLYSQTGAICTICQQSAKLFGE